MARAHAALPGWSALADGWSETGRLDDLPAPARAWACRYMLADLASRYMAALQLRPASVDAVVSFYALIHVPVPDQQALFPRIRDWLRPGGYFLATVGAERWTGTERYLGADMFWDHMDTATYLRWLHAARLTPIWSRYVPDGTSGHSLILAEAA
jgi:SAM-dependent methyltransferase